MIVYYHCGIIVIHDVKEHYINKYRNQEKESVKQTQYLWVVFIEDNLAWPNEKEREALLIHIKRTAIDRGINNDTRKDAAHTIVWSFKPLNSKTYISFYYIPSFIIQQRE